MNRLLPALALVLLTAAAPLPASAPSEVTIAQLQYGGGGDWYANPSGLPNLMREIAARTGLPVANRPAQTSLTDPELWRYPFLYMTGHGNVRFTEEEVRLLRRYLIGGGFLHADDNYGMDESFRREIARVFPEYSLVQVPNDHAIYHSFYEFPQGLPKIHLHDGNAPQGLGIFHQGRLVVFYSYETDLGNGWEDADRHGNPPEARENAFRMGVNLFIYALAQVAS